MARFEGGKKLFDQGAHFVIFNAGMKFAHSACLNTVPV
jgi:hypothetical protein